MKISLKPEKVWKYRIYICQKCIPNGTKIKL